MELRLYRKPEIGVVLRFRRVVWANLEQRSNGLTKPKKKKKTLGRLKHM